MSFRIRVSGAVKESVDAGVPRLVETLVASGITDLNPTLWGSAAEAEASIRLGWVQSVTSSRAILSDIGALREKLLAHGVSRFVLAGMGGSSLAPEVITQTFNADLTILDSTEPGQVHAALQAGVSDVALIVSSKSGSTVETDSQLRTFRAAFDSAGIDPTERIVVVTDPGSPLDTASRKAGYATFNADPNVGGRFSALTAFGLVPSGLAGVNVSELLDEAEAVLLDLAVDHEDNPGLILGVAMAARVPMVDKLGLVSDGTHIVGLPNWIEQLVAESTGKQGTGILPVVLDVVSTEVTNPPADLVLCRILDDAHEQHLLGHDRHDGEILVSGTLGAQFMVWEYATAVAGVLLQINPFDQPDVESAKIAARALLDHRPEQTAPLFVDNGIEVRAHGDFLGSAKTVREAISATLACITAHGYLSVQAYVDRATYPQLDGVRELVAARAGRPVTFGWGPRFLHSTGQFHKGGPAVGVFIQVLQTPTTDLEIPERPFTFGQLIEAQAAGDANVLAQLGRPVLTLTLTRPDAQLVSLFEAFN